jgi:hypothetical protein
VIDHLRELCIRLGCRGQWPLHKTCLKQKCRSRDVDSGVTWREAEWRTGALLEPLPVCSVHASTETYKRSMVSSSHSSVGSKIGAPVKGANQETDSRERTAEDELKLIDKVKEVFLECDHIEWTSARIPQLLCARGASGITTRHLAWYLAARWSSSLRRRYCSGSEVWCACGAIE